MQGEMTGSGTVDDIVVSIYGLFNMCMQSSVHKSYCEAMKVETLREYQYERIPVSLYFPLCTSTSTCEVSLYVVN